MKQKILWTITMLLLNGYLIFWLFYMREHDLSTGLGWVSFFSDLFAIAVLISVFGAFLSLVISLFPKKQLSFKEKFKLNFPVGLISILVFLFVIFGYTAYLEKRTGTKILHTNKYDEILPADEESCYSIRDGRFETDNVFIWRQGNKQFEISKWEQGIQEYKVQWLSDCEYQLTPLDKTHDAIRVKIIYVSKELYICNSTRDGKAYIRHELKIIAPPEQTNETCLPYFEYDHLVHYSLKISDEEAQNPAITDTYSEEKKKLVEFLNYMGPSNSLEPDTVDIAKFENWGFVRNEIPVEQFGKINQLFCQRKHEIAQFAACVPIYRDVLVFKKSNKTVGVARICFDCGMNYITGTKRNTEEFGQSGDYDKLRDFLHPFSH